jgi:dipeptidyl aminopeptidase/acylaminoacyl peptidase
MHPDGNQVVFVVNRLDLEADQYRRHLMGWDGAEVRFLTDGPIDTRPRWSPDGDRILFLRATADEPKVPQVHVLQVTDGATVRLTHFDHGAREAEWSPDGTRIAAVGITWAPEWADLTDEERGRRPARWTRHDWPFDNEGTWHDRRSHVYLLDPAVEGVDLLTPGDFKESAVTWHPDGDRIAFLSARHDQRRLDAGIRAWEVSVAGGDPEPLVDIGMWDWVGYRPDGVVHVAGLRDQWDHPAVGAVFRREEDGRLTDLTGRLDRSPVPLAPKVAPWGPQWVDDGFLTVLEDSGSIRVVRVGDDGTITDFLPGGERVITGVTPNHAGDRCAYVVTSPTDPGELWFWDGSERQVTHLNQDFRAPLVEPESFTIHSDGVEIQAWAYLPPGNDRVPLLLNIHGGPATQYGWGFFDEFQVYAAAGYGVVACNPRGSSGRGRDFVRAVVGTWGEERPPDLRDLEGIVDAALERFPRLDTDRIGVMGGSYGGFATIRLLALADRYRSGVVERALAAFPSFTGTSDIGPFFARMYLGTQAPGGSDELSAASPMAFAHDITTPTLVIHSESDFRTPIEQGEQLFTMLQMQGVESEMLRFSGEGHELSRSGSPRHRLERLEAILDWHDRHLR